MKNTILIIALISLISGCKKSGLSLIGGPMTVTRIGTTAQFEEVNVFSPNGDGLNDYFSGPMTYCQTDSNDQIVNCLLKIKSQNSVIFSGNVNINNYVPGWNGENNNSPVPEGIYTYEADYTTINGTAKVFGSVGVWRSSSVSCSQKSLFRFMSNYNSNCIYDSSAIENIPCH